MVSQSLIKFLIFNLLVVVLAPKVFAQGVNVTATVDRNQMAKGDTFTYQIKVSADRSVNSGAPILPKMDQFDLINTWTGSESRSSFVNGKFQVQQSKIYNYMLAPKVQGKLKIAAASIQVGGASYQTKPIIVTVSKSQNTQQPSRRQAQPRRPVDPFQQLEDQFNQLLQRRQGTSGFQTQPINPKEAFFIQVDVDKTKVYAGEQVTASWYLYTRGQIRDIDTLKYPSLNGFWKEEIELATRLNFTQEIVNGIVYKKALLASFALFPIKPGKAKLDSYKAKCTVITPSNFGFGRPYQSTKVSRPISIEVLPVPVDGRPADYSGAVGNFEVSAKISSQQGQVNQPLTYKIRFEGAGNAKLIDLPSLNFPNALEEYDTKVDSKFFKNGQSYKEFELLLIPREPGDFSIPPLSISLFDPKTGAYYQKKIDPIELKILPGSGQEIIPSSPMAKKSGSEESTGPTLPNLILEWDTGSHASVWTPVVTWSGLYLFALLILGWRVRKEFGFGQNKKDMERILGLRMQKIQKSLDAGDWRGVGVQSTNSLYSVLGEISGEGGASHELEKLLQKSPPSLRRELGDDFAKHLQYFESLSFAPEDILGPLKEKGRLKLAIKELEKTLFQAISIALKEPDESTNGEDNKTPPPA